MAEVSAEAVKRTAHLARLKVENIEETIKNLSNIVAQADLLAEIDTTDIEPTNHAMPLENVFREDVLAESYPREVILQNAKSRAGCYVVPKTFDGGAE